MSAISELESPTPNARGRRAPRWLWVPECSAFACSSDGTTVPVTRSRRSPRRSGSTARPVTLNGMISNTRTPGTVTMGVGRFSPGAQPRRTASPGRPLPPPRSRLSVRSSEPGPLKVTDAPSRWNEPNPFRGGRRCRDDRREVHRDDVRRSVPVPREPSGARRGGRSRQGGAGTRPSRASAEPRGSSFMVPLRRDQTAPRGAP